MTVFVIIGIVIAVAVALLLYFRADVSDALAGIEVFKPAPLTADAQNVKDSLESCAAVVLESGLISLGIQGGYISIEGIPASTVLKSAVLDSSWSYKGTAYGYFSSTNRIPSAEAAGKELATFLNTNIPLYCKGAKEGVTYADKATSKVTVGSSKVNAEVKWVITVKKGETESKIRSLSAESPVRLGALLPIIKQMVDEQVKASKSEVCLSCWTKIAADNSLKVDIQKTGDDTFFMITDTKSRSLGNEKLELPGRDFYIFGTALKLA